MKTFFETQTGGSMFDLDQVAAIHKRNREIRLVNGILFQLAPLEFDAFMEFMKDRIMTVSLNK